VLGVALDRFGESTADDEGSSLVDGSAQPGTAETAWRSG